MKHHIAALVSASLEQQRNDTKVPSLLAGACQELFGTSATCRHLRMDSVMLEGPASHEELRQNSRLCERCCGHRARVLARQRRVYCQAARYWQPGLGIPHGGGRLHLLTMLLRVCHHDSTRTRCVAGPGMYLVQSEAAPRRQHTERMLECVYKSKTILTALRITCNDVCS